MSSPLGAAWPAALTVLFGACAPDTELLGEGGASPDATSPAMAAGAALIDPTPGDGAVPVNLAAVLVRFPSRVMLGGDVLPAGAMTISSAGRPPVSAEAATTVPCPGSAAGTCFRSALGERLLPSTTYLVALGAGVLDGEGHPVPGGAVGQFVTGGEADLTAPGIAALAVTPSGPCALVSFQTDEPATGILVLRGPDLVERTVPAGAGTTAFSVAASLSTYGAGAEVQVVARAVDLGGNVAESAAVSLVVPPGLLPLAITELQANPAGAEPAQEFVEIRNLGQESLDLTGITIEDSKGADNLPATMLAAGAFALIVASGFDAASPVDTPPRPGTALLRVDTRIGADGLANGGEVVRLRNASGAVLSSYASGVDVSAAKWSGKSVHRVPQDACDQPASWSQSPLPATPGWGPP